MGKDKKLISLFVDEYSHWSGREYSVTGWPDADTRDRKAIDALASDSGGHLLAIEHTLLQPFTGDKADQTPFLKTIGRLDRRQDLAEPNWMIDLIIQVGAIRKGVDWTEVANGLEAWFLAIRASLPAGRSVYDVTGLPCPVRVTVGKSSLPDTTGLLFVSRHMPAESIEPVLRSALAAKLPKLAATTASERILLLELDSPARGNWEIGQAIEDVRSDFPDIGLISTIWLAKTMVWESEGYVGFHLIWPLDQVEHHQEWWKENQTRRRSSALARIDPGLLGTSGPRDSSPARARQGQARFARHLR